MQSRSAAKSKQCVQVYKQVLFIAQSEFDLYTVLYCVLLSGLVQLFGPGKEREKERERERAYLTVILSLLLFQVSYCVVMLHMAVLLNKGGL